MYAFARVVEELVVEVVEVAVGLSVEEMGVALLVADEEVEVEQLKLVVAEAMAWRVESTLEVGVRQL